MNNDTVSVRLCTSPRRREAGGWMLDAGGWRLDAGGGMLEAGGETQEA